MRSPIIVIGCRRSGTTLLRSMLERHPDLLVHPKEPQFILGLYRQFGTTIHDVPAAFDYLLNHPYVPEGITADTLHTALAQKTTISLKDLIHLYLAAWGGDALNQKHAVLKDPEFTFHLDLIHHLFPQTHIIHIVRDARANISSQRARWRQATLWECVMWWRQAVQAARAWQKSGQTPYSELQYEQLVLEPEAALRQLCHDLQLPYVAEMLSFEFKGRLYAPDAPPEPVRLTAVDPSRLTLWQERFTPMEIRLIETGCQREMAWWDYALTCPDVPPLPFMVYTLREKLIYQLRTWGRRLKAIR